MKTANDLNITAAYAPADCGYIVTIYHNGAEIDSGFVDGSMDVEQFMNDLLQSWVDSYNAI